jgi:hypothetical protein
MLWQQMTTVQNFDAIIGMRWTGEILQIEVTRLTDGLGAQLLRLSAVQLQSFKSLRLVAASKFCARFPF